MSVGTRLFVGNLPENTNEHELHSAFSAYGEITNLELKSKSTNPDENRKFAFVTLSAANNDVESCIKKFQRDDFLGARLYVTRARESFLERLQRERQEALKKESTKNENIDLPKENPIIQLGEKLNPRKRKNSFSNDFCAKPKIENHKKHTEINHYPKAKENNKTYSGLHNDEKKSDADKKRLESMKKKRQEFKQKQMIIKTGLTSVDKVQNKKVIFSDGEKYTENTPQYANGDAKLDKKRDKVDLFDEDDESGDEINFDIKKQYEGKTGQKVLDLQSRYKSDKRFTLDERFIDDNQLVDDNDQNRDGDDERIDVEQTDEKSKQLDILQDVLGISIKKKKVVEHDSKKTKPKMGMLRFDPTQPDHAKFLAPIEEIKQDSHKNTKKKKSKEKKDENKEEIPPPEVEKVEVSKEQFYKISETLKEAIAQPTEFSLRSLFANNNDAEQAPPEQDQSYIPIEATKAPKVKNPLNNREKNPFVYDSSDSEAEEVDSKNKTVPLPVVTEPPPVVTETKAVWKENLFFAVTDQRLKDGLAFFNTIGENEPQKERRELKCLMKKRIYNKERKNQMFQKKIGGRKKTMKKSLRKD